MSNPLMVDTYTQPTPAKPGTGAMSRFEHLEKFREPFLERARAVSKLTIPTEIPSQGHTPWETFPTPYQSAGSRGVSNLASKLMMTLFPPNTPFFTLSVDAALIAQAVEASGADPSTVETEIQQSLVGIEGRVSGDVDRLHMRPALQRAFRHLVIGGNAMIHIPAHAQSRMIPLSRYTLNRDSMGRVVELLVFESIDPRTLRTEEQQGVVQSEPGLRKKFEAGEPVSMFTWSVATGVNPEDGTLMFEQSQWIENTKVPGTETKYRADESEWIPLAINRADEESYGRGAAEEFMGDIKTLEGLTRATVEAAAAAARIIFLVKPGSTVRVRSLASAPNGSFREGDPEDVGTLRVDKNADLQFATNLMGSIESRLDEAFLVGKSVRRDAERVTAEEIAFMVQQLEDTQVGVYSTLAGSLQLAVVQRLMAMRRNSGKDKDLKALKRSVLQPKVIAGLEGLGRGHDLRRLQVAMSTIREFYGENAIEQWINIPEGAKRVFNAAGVQAEGLLKSEEEVQQAQQSAQAAQMVQAGIPNAVAGVAKATEGAPAVAAPEAQ